MTGTSWAELSKASNEAERSRDEQASPVLYSLQHALQDFAVVFGASTVVFVFLVLLDLTGPLLAWADAYPRLRITELFLYAILISVGFGVAILRRWVQLTEVAQQQEATRRELERKANALERSNAELERFAYAASHDLREPLRMVHSYLSLLERQLDGDDLDDDAREFLDEARNASRRMDRMVRGILDYARLSPEAETSEPVDTKAALDDALGNLAARLEASDVTIEQGALPDVIANREEVATVFQNLLQNAFVHGGPDLSTITIEGELVDGSAILRVSDDGWGIEETQQDRIFEMFRQGGGSSTSAGAGMGLALCQRIAERHDGRLDVTSERGEGSTFEITLKAAAETDASPARASSAGTAQANA